MIDCCHILNDEHVQSLLCDVATRYEDIFQQRFMLIDVHSRNVVTVKCPRHMSQSVP